MKKKIFIVILGYMVISLLCSVYITNLNSDKEVSNSYPTVLFSEVYLSQEELIAKSDLIVVCKFNGKKETKIVSSKPNSEKGESGLEAPVTTYKMKPIEVLKGSVNDEFIINTFGGADSFLEKGESYILFLNINPDNTYRLVSNGQGMNKVTFKNKSLPINDEINDVDIGIQTKNNEAFNYKMLKDKIQELKK